MTQLSVQPTFLLYDYETFGKHTALDRPVQFAAVRTNNQLEIIENSKVFFCQPADDYLPDPEAVLVTGITPQQALRVGIIEAEFANHINRIFNVPNTCILGYNNIHFDDEISRNLFYRNFYDPYSWSWQHGNSRWDLINVVRAFYSLRPDGIHWPIKENGLPSFKLEHLTLANDIEHNNTHDAMSDIYATLALAKLMRKTQPRLFNYLYKYRRKQQLKTLININKMIPLVYVSNIFRSSYINTTLIAPIAWHPNNPDILIVCDLSCDLQLLLSLDANELYTQLYTKSHISEHYASSMPLKLIYLNKCPILTPVSALRVLDIKRLNIKQQLCLNNLSLLRMQPELREKVIFFFKNYLPILDKNKSYTNSDVDTQLYKNFFSKADRALMSIILSTIPENLSKLNLDSFDIRIKPLLFRYRAHNFPFTLNNEEKLYWLEHRKKRFTQSFLETYIQKLKDLYLIHFNNDYKIQIINELFAYFKILCESFIR